MIDVGASLISILKLNLVVYLLLKLYLVSTVGRCKSKKRMDGKVVIITGANSGIGKQTAKDLVHRGARVIFGCRNLAKAQEAAQEILREEPKGQIVIKYIDNTKLDTVRAFAKEIITEEEKIDVLINNAGIKGDNFKLTVDGFEEIYQVNYLAPFLLTELLTPLLKKSSPARVINVGSLSYIVATCDPNTLADDFRSPFKAPNMRYSGTKLLLLMWTKRLHDELRGSGVAVNVVHPGLVLTPIAFKRLSFYDLWVTLWMLSLGRSAKDGAQTLIHLSVEDIADSDNGRYWAECKPRDTWKGNDPDTNDRVVRITRRVLRERPHSD